MVTANRLRDGAVVFLAAGGALGERVGEGHVAETESQPPSCCATAEAMATEVVAPYLIEVAADRRAAGRPHVIASASGPRAQRGRVRRCGTSRGGRKLAMYAYDNYDHSLVAERVAQFRDQVARRIAGEISEDEFKPLRLMNGLYLQLHAYMLRIAIPYGTLTRPQLRKLAQIARRYDRGYGHFTTRQNIQFNWIKLEETPDILAELAERRDACHPDQRQLHPQRHRRSFRRRCRRRDRGSAHLVRDHPAMVDLPSGILVPAAQVQDRRHRLAA